MLKLVRSTGCDGLVQAWVEFRLWDVALMLPRTGFAETEAQTNSKCDLSAAVNPHVIRFECMWDPGANMAASHKKEKKI